MQNISTEHCTVLLDEAVSALVNKPDGFYVDGTFGRGGHSRLLLQKLEGSAHLLAVDKDPEAMTTAGSLALGDMRVSVQRGGFAEIGHYLDDLGWTGIHGLLLDLGVSSPQLDDAQRGFSFMRDGPLDMRMDPERGSSAAAWLAKADEKEIADVLWLYGEERFSRRIARLLVEQRQLSPIDTTRRLASLVDEALPFREKGKHPATRTFQAIRIFINQELVELEAALAEGVKRLLPGGRLVVISFHSLEDRIVKRFMRDLARGPQVPRGLPIRSDMLMPSYRLVGKAVQPTMDEVTNNPRARSAVMRVLEKI